MGIVCKHCGSNILVKDGMVAGKQRWKCTKCHKTMRAGDKREKHDLWKKMLAIRMHREGISLNKIAGLLGISRSIVLYWLKNYKTIIKNEMNSIDFPRNAKNIMLLEQKHLKYLRDDVCFDQAFGIIWTNSKSDIKTIVFVMGKV